MKFLIPLSLGFIALSAMAGNPLDSDEHARQVAERHNEAFMAMKGVYDLSLTGCDPLTGKPDVNHDFVHCIGLEVKTKTAAKALKALYPVGSKIDGVFITVNDLRDARPEDQPPHGPEHDPGRRPIPSPRGSAGN